MVPRMRTVGGCCTHAAKPGMEITMSEAVSTRDINEAVFGMAASSQGFTQPKEKTPRLGSYSMLRAARGSPPSHRRGRPAAADTPAGGFVGTARQPFH